MKRVSRSELDILRYVMEHEPVAVRAVADAMAETRGVARTTVATLLERLRSKGYLERSEIEGVNQYSLAVDRGSLMKEMVGDFVSSALGGSMSPLIAYLTERVNLTKAEEQELSKIIERIEREEKK